MNTFLNVTPLKLEPPLLLTIDFPSPPPTRTPKLYVDQGWQSTACGSNLDCFVFVNTQPGSFLNVLSVAAFVLQCRVEHLQRDYRAHKAQHI